MTRAMTTDDKSHAQHSYQDSRSLGCMLCTAEKSTVFDDELGLELK